MIIWIDADACPKPVREIIYRASRRVDVPVKLVANQPMHTPPGPLISSIVVSQGADEADAYIAEHVNPEDLVITADIPLAAKIVERGSLGINPRGEVYTKANVRERLSIRDAMADLRELGVFGGGAKPFDAKAKQRFANALDRELTRRLRQHQR